MHIDCQLSLLLKKDWTTNFPISISLITHNLSPLKEFFISLLMFNKLVLFTRIHALRFPHRNKNQNIIREFWYLTDYWAMILEVGQLQIPH